MTLALALLAINGSKMVSRRTKQATNLSSNESPSTSHTRCYLRGFIFNESVI